MIIKTLREIMISVTVIVEAVVVVVVIISEILTELRKYSVSPNH
jgi:hypothetical protein